MRQGFRLFGVAVLAVALLDASAGLCFCHRGPASPGAAPASHGCCHEQGASGQTALKAATACCSGESAESAATPSPAVHLAPPATPSVAVVVCRASGEARSFMAAALPGFSPTPVVLRI